MDYTKSRYPEPSRSIRALGALAVCAEAGSAEALERVVGALFDADPSQAAAVVQQTPIDLRWVDGEVFGAFGGPGAALAAGWFYISVATSSTRLMNSHAQGTKGPRRAGRADHRSVDVVAFF